MARRLDEARRPGSPTRGPTPHSKLSARASLESVRGAIVIDPTSSVRVNFDVDTGEGGVSVPFFECKACEELLNWAPAEQHWVCTGCGYELTPPEARVLLDVTRQKLGYLEQYVDRKAGAPVQPKKGWIAWLLGLFSRKQQLPEPSSKSSENG
jgi:hypothetical protein